MNMLRLSNGKNLFEMDVQIEQDDSLQSCGEAYLTIYVMSEGFSGHNDLWVTGKQIEQFCKGLVTLERTLTGVTELASISPNELYLQILSVTSRGNVAVKGQCGYEVQGENESFWHSVAFGFEFEPSQLTAAVKLPWVRKYVGK